MLSLRWLISSALFFVALFTLDTAHAQIGSDPTYIFDCVVKDSGSLKVSVYEKASSNSKVIGTIDVGDVVFSSSRTPWYGAPGFLPVDGFEKGAFTYYGYIQIEHLDCEGAGITSEYPVVINQPSELKDAFGLAGDFDNQPAVTHEKNRCFGKEGMGPDLSMSDTFLEPYRRQKMPISNLCITLKSSDIRFDPETGKRLPTYVVPKTTWSEEYLLIAPLCVARGVFKNVDHGGGIKGAQLYPVGCKISYHPWSGRALKPEIAAALTKRLLLSVGGMLGAANDDSAALAAQSPTRVLTLTKIDALRQQMKSR